MTTKHYCQTIVTLSLLIPLLFPYALLAFPGMVVFVIYSNIQLQKAKTPKQAAQFLVKTPNLFIPFGFFCFLIFSLLTAYKITEISSTSTHASNANIYLLLNGALIEAATLSLFAWFISYLYLGMSGTVFYFFHKFGLISDLKPSSISSVVPDSNSSEKIESLTDKLIDKKENANLKNDKLLNFIFYLLCTAVLIFVFVLASQMLSLTTHQTPY